MEEKTNNLVAKHARKYNKAAVHKDRKKAMKKGDRKHKGKYESVDEVLKVSDGAAAWIKDFQSSDAPQFKGKSMDKRKEMALAAYLDAKKGSKEESVDEVFTTTAIANFFKKSGDKKKYDKVVKDIKKGKYTVSKASQLFDLDGHILQSMVSEWSSNTTETSRRVKGGDKRKRYMKEKQVEEDKKGLWDRIRAKRKRGEKPAKPGDEDYPKTLDIESVREGKTLHINLDAKDSPRQRQVTSVLKRHEKSGAIEFDGETDKGALFKINKPGVENAINKELKRLGGGYQLGEGLKQARKNVGSDSCWDGYKAKGTKMKNGKEVPDCEKEGFFDKKDDKKDKKKENPRRKSDSVNKLLSRSKQMRGRREEVEESAQDRLDRMAKKHGLGKPNKAADDYISKMMKKYGAKDMADLKKKMGMKESVETHEFTELFLDEGLFSSLGSKLISRIKGVKSKGSAFLAKKKKSMKKEEFVSELTQRDLERIAARKDQNLSKRGKAPKKPKAAGRVSNVGRGKDEADDNLIMQLRKAQDKKGKMKVKFRGGEKELPLRLIDKILATYDKARTPQDKKKVVSMTTHELRKLAGLKSKMKGDDAPPPRTYKPARSFNQKGAAKKLGKFSKSRKGGDNEPSNKDLKDIERGK